MILVSLSSIALVYGVRVDQKVAILRALRQDLDASVDVLFACHACKTLSTSAMRWLALGAIHIGNDVQVQ
jgi:hypothetical protein